MFSLESPCLILMSTHKIPFLNIKKKLILNYPKSATMGFDSNEYTQNTISQYKKENHSKLSQICNYGICSKGLRNEFETAVVNEPSAFEPLKFYCILLKILPYFFSYKMEIVYSKTIPKI